MSLLTILVLTAAALLVGLLSRFRGRVILLMIASLLAIYVLQPSTPIRHLDFWLPTLTIGLVALVWALTRSSTSPPLRHDLPALLITASVVLAIGLQRYLGPLCCLTPSRPPDALQVLLALLILAGLILLITRLSSSRNALITVLILLILGLFIILKSETLAQLASSFLRALTGQSSSSASALDLRWLGFSYVAFRLLHALRDRLTSRLPDVTFAEFLVFIIFFPAYTAGPIDRLPRFLQDLRQPFRLEVNTLLLGGQRILIGVFNKFVLADTLAIIALNDLNATQTTSVGWLWVLLYAYAFRIYFDFAGYTDIAIGLGMWMGIQLPENFSRPYLKPNLTQFWNSWHITLAQWFRAYYFNPLTRSLRSSARKIPMPWNIFFGQVTTMLMIGLWHGLTWNFALWGIWHGLGLFVHNRWSEFIRSRVPIPETKPWLQRCLELSGIILTFNYVALGWVWFGLTSLDLSWHVLLKLFGLAGGG